MRSALHIGRRCLMACRQAKAMSRSCQYVTVVCGALMIVVPLAHARKPSAKTVRVCYSALRDERELHLSSGGQCSASERSLVWSLAGQRGLRGVQGERGTEGKEGRPSPVVVVSDDDTMTESNGDDVGRIIGSFAWPLAVLLILVLVLFSKPGRDLLEKISARITRIRGGPVEIELSPEKSEQVKRGLEETLEAFRRPVVQEFDRWVNVEHVNDLLERVCGEVIQPALMGGQGFQTTIYVRDVLAKDLLYRLVDYYPAGNGRGKVYSIRFGIIGRSWRRGETLCETVPAQPLELIDTWGMKREETVQRAGDAKTFACVMLRNSDNAAPVGLLFLSSQTEGRLTESLVKGWEQTEAVKALAAAVENVTRKLAEVARPPIALFDA